MKNKTLTSNEFLAIYNMNTSDFAGDVASDVLDEAHVDHAIWYWCATDGFGPSAGGIVASLSKKKFVYCQDKGKDATVTLTASGMKAFRSMAHAMLTARGYLLSDTHLLAEIVSEMWETFNAVQADVVETGLAALEAQNATMKKLPAPKASKASIPTTFEGVVADVARQYNINPKLARARLRAAKLTAPTLADVVRVITRA